MYIIRGGPHFGGSYCILMLEQMQQKYSIHSILDSLVLITHISFGSDSLGYLAVSHGEIQVQKLAYLTGYQHMSEDLGASDHIS